MPRSVGGRILLAHVLLLAGFCRAHISSVCTLTSCSDPSNAQIFIRTYHDLKARAQGQGHIIAPTGAQTDFSMSVSCGLGSSQPTDDVLTLEDDILNGGGTTLPCPDATTGGRQLVFNDSVLTCYSASTVTGAPEPVPRDGSTQSNCAYDGYPASAMYILPIENVVSGIYQFWLTGVDQDLAPAPSGVVGDPCTASSDGVAKNSVLLPLSVCSGTAQCPDITGIEGVDQDYIDAKCSSATNTLYSGFLCPSPCAAGNTAIGFLTCDGGAWNPDFECFNGTVCSLPGADNRGAGISSDITITGIYGDGCGLATKQDTACSFNCAGGLVSEKPIRCSSTGEWVATDGPAKCVAPPTPVPTITPTSSPTRFPRVGDFFVLFDSSNAIDNAYWEVSPLDLNAPHTKYNEAKNAVSSAIRSDEFLQYFGETREWRVGLAQFAFEVRKQFALTKNRSAIETGFESMKWMTGGSNALAAAIRQGMENVLAEDQMGGVDGIYANKVILIVTANVETDFVQVQQTAADAHAAGVMIYSVGFGAEFSSSTGDSGTESPGDGQGQREARRALLESISTKTWFANDETELQQTVMSALRIVTATFTQPPTPAPVLIPTRAPTRPTFPWCEDGMRNHQTGETDIDCGGPCAGCGHGKLCLGDLDCISEVCDMGTCVGGEEPTRTPTAAPTHYCDDRIDWMLMVDSSASVEPYTEYHGDDFDYNGYKGLRPTPNFDARRDSLRDWVSTLPLRPFGSNSGSRIGLGQYSSAVHEEWNLGTYAGGNQAALLDAFNRIRWQAGSTNIDAAIIHGAQELASGRGSRGAAHKVLVVMAEGGTDAGGSAADLSIAAAEQHARQARASDPSIDIYVILHLHDNSTSSLPADLAKTQVAMSFSRITGGIPNRLYVTTSPDEQRQALSLLQEEVCKRFTLAPTQFPSPSPTEFPTFTLERYCTDGKLGYGETDVDCGGYVCNKCLSGRHCEVSSDCLSGRCVNSACGVVQTPTPTLTPTELPGTAAVVQEERSIDDDSKTKSWQERRSVLVALIAVTIVFFVCTLAIWGHIKKLQRAKARNSSPSRPSTKATPPSPTKPLELGTSSQKKIFSQQHLAPQQHIQHQLIQQHVQPAFQLQPPSPALGRPVSPIIQTAVERRPVEFDSLRLTLNTQQQQQQTSPSSPASPAQVDNTSPSSSSRSLRGSSPGLADGRTTWLVNTSPSQMSSMV